MIGVDTAAGTGGAEAGYAIPINTAMSAERKIVSGRPSPGIVLGVGGFLGVIVPSTTAPSPRAQAAQERSLGTDPVGSASQIGCLPTEAGAGVPISVAPVDSGALVDGVLCGTAADAAGLTAGDVIITADGRAVSSPDALTAIVERLPARQRGLGHLGQPGRRDPDVPGPARRRARRVKVSGPPGAERSRAPGGERGSRVRPCNTGAPLAGVQPAFRFERLTRR